MSTPTEVVRKYLEAHNSHQVEQTMACVTDTFRFEMSGAWTRIGRDNMRQLEEWDAVVNDHISYTICNEEQDKVYFAASETCNWYSVFNISEIQYNQCVATVKGDLVSELVVKYSPESEQALAVAFTKVLKWAEKGHKKEIDMLMPAGEFIYNRKNAEIWLNLVKGWMKG